MARRHPLCAVCGGSLVSTAQIRIKYEGLPGKPEIGWHDRCLGNERHKDTLMRDLREDSDSPEAREKLALILESIGLRGKGRLVGNKDLSLKRIATGR